MKVFVLALLLLVLTTALIGGGSWYVHRTLGELVGILEDMKTLDMGKLEQYGVYEKQFQSVWGDSKRWLHIVMGREVTDRIEDSFTGMGIHYLGDDAVSYAWEREMLSRYLKRLVKQEELSTDGIL